MYGTTGRSRHAPEKLSEGKLEFSRNLNGRTGMKKSRYTEEQIIALTVGVLLVD